MTQASEIAGLTDAEATAIRNAAIWYANYHARIIADSADDRSAAQVAKQRRYDDLLSALRKLGARIHDPREPVTSITPVLDESAGSKAA